MVDKQLHRKIIGVPLQKGIQKNEDGSVLVLGRFTSDNRDEVGDIITRTATERAIPRYRQWGNIRYMHQPRPVGRVTRIGSADGLEWNEVEIKVIDPQAAFEVEQGLLQALSVGILVNFVDVEMLADGGWVINDYQLAEISLVDHPANYDARLLLNSIDDATRTLIREQGLVPALRSMGITIQGETKSMEQTDKVQKDIELEIPAEEPVTPEDEAPAPEAAVSEQPEAQAEPVVEEEKTVEAEEVTAPVVEETPVDQAAPAVDPVATVIENAFGAMSETLKAINSTLAMLMEQQKTLKAEVQVAPERREGEAVATKSLEELEAENAELKVRVAELSMPAPDGRKGMIPTEEVPAEAPVEEPVAEEKAVDLRSAIRKYVETKNRR